MSTLKVVNRPYCRECFSKQRRKISNGFVKLEDEIVSSGEKSGLSPEQLEEIKDEIRIKLAQRLQHLDREHAGKTASAVAAV